MSDLRRLIDLNINVETAAAGDIRNAAFVNLDRAITVHRGTQLLIRATLLLSNTTTPFACPADASFLWGADNVYTADHDDLILSQNADFNVAGDWADADPTAGKICWRADLTGVDLKTALGSAASATLHTLLWMSSAAGYTVLCDLDITVKNIAVDPTTAKVIPGITHITYDAAAALYVPRLGDQARWRWKSDAGAEGWQYRFEDDDKWRSMLPIIKDGQPTITWGDPVD